MTSQSRKQRRAAERENHDEFSPEFIAEANAVRERVQARIHANRSNALHSTGPRSPEGKLASSRNSLKHGLASSTLLIPGEDPAHFESLLEALLADHQPANATEEMLIHQMAQSFWLTQRALRLQNECFTATEVDEKRLALFLRYQTTHERAFHKALATLMRLQKEAHRAGAPRPSRSGSAHCARLQKDRRCLEKHAGGFVSQPQPATSPETGFVSQNTQSSPFECAFLPQDAPRSPLAEAP